MSQTKTIDSETFVSSNEVRGVYPMHLWLNCTGNQRVLTEHRAAYIQDVDRVFELAEGALLSNGAVRAAFMSAAAPAQVVDKVTPTVQRVNREQRAGHTSLLTTTTIAAIVAGVTDSLWLVWRDSSPEQK